MTVPVKLRSIPLWTPNWDRAALLKRQEQHYRSFRRGFQMVAFSSDEATYPSFKSCEHPGVDIQALLKSGWPAFTGVDPSGSKRKGNAIVSVVLDPVSRRRYLVDVRFGAWRSSELADQISEVYRIVRPTVIMVEDNGYQEAIVDWVIRDKARYPWWMIVEPTTTTGGKKHDLVKGLPGLEVEFHNGAWVFPLNEYEGTGVSVERVSEDGEEELIVDVQDVRRAAFARLAYEIRHHPIAATTDGLMALWFARQGIELYGSGFDGGGELGDVNLR